jgi:hypothetical protein
MTLRLAALAGADLEALAALDAWRSRFPLESDPFRGLYHTRQPKALLAVLVARDVCKCLFRLITVRSSLTGLMVFRINTIVGCERLA